MVTFGAGNRLEFDKNYPCGIAHFMEHMRFKGSKSRTAKQMLMEIAYNGGDMNAWTSEDAVSYFITIPEENIETAFKVMHDIVHEPIFPQKEMEKEQEVVCQEIRAYDDEMHDNIYQETMKWAFSNNLMYPVVGFEDTVRQITRDDLVRFDRDFYNPEQMLVSLASKNNHSFLVEKYLGIPDDNFKIPPRTKETEYGPSFVGEIKKDGVIQTDIMVTFGGPHAHDIYFTNRPAVCIFDMIFGASDDSRLFMNLREDSGLVYGVSSSVHDMLDGSLFAIHTETEPDKKDRVLQAIDDEVDRMLNEAPTEEELQRAKNRYKSHMYHMLDRSYYMADMMLEEEMYGHKFDSSYLAEIDSITSNDVLDVAQAILGRGNRYVAIGMGTN